MKVRLVNMISYLLIFLFIYASISKLLDYEKFRVQIGQSPLLTTMSDFVVWFIPLAEVVISVLLVFSRSRLAGLYLAFGLMTLFSAYIIAILNFGVFVPCSCGGILQNMTWDTHLIFNLFFVLICIIAIYLEALVQAGNRHYTSQTI